MQYSFILARSENHHLLALPHVYCSTAPAGAGRKAGAEAGTGPRPGTVQAQSDAL